MTALNEVYKCEICGNIVEVLHTGKGVLFCCGKPMELLKEMTEEDEYREKHVPVAVLENGKLKVTVGSVVHPMLDEHYIEWIEVLEGDNVCRKNLKPGEKPEACFADSANVDGVRAYCNLHGLWKTDVK